MRLVDRLRPAAHACIRTPRRGVLTALVLVMVGFGAWHGIRLLRAESAIKQAEESLARYDFAAARGHSERAAELRPGKPSVWLLAAQAARRDGQPTEAAKHLRQYKTLAGATPEGRLETLLQTAQTGDIDRADVFDLTAKADAGHAATEQILEALAVGAIHIYHFALAEVWVEHLLRGFPKNPVGRLIRARMDDVVNKRDRATAGCRELLVDFPDNYPAKVLLAGLLYRAQQYDEAARLYEELRRARPDDLIPVLGLIRTRARAGRSDEARPLYQELQDRFAGSSEALLECARFALDDSRPADAERLLQRAVELAPSNHEVHLLLGRTLERVGKPDEARPHFERYKKIEVDLLRMDDLMKAVVNSPRDPAPRREAGAICLRNGQSAEGLRWLQGALGVAPDDPATHAALAEYYAERGDLTSAGYHRRRAR